MESRLIYIKANSIKSKINWKNQSQTEWIHVGLGHELKTELILQEIRNLSSSQLMYLVLGRTNSFEITYSEIEEEVVKRIGKEDFLITDKTFSRFVEVRSIGVIRVGSK